MSVSTGSTSGVGSTSWAAAVVDVVGGCGGVIASASTGVGVLVADALSDDVEELIFCCGDALPPMPATPIVQAPTSTARTTAMPPRNNQVLLIVGLP